jgi:hypothetical protein
VCCDVVFCLHVEALVDVEAAGRRAHDGARDLRVPVDLLDLLLTLLLITMKTAVIASSKEVENNSEQVINFRVRACVVTSGW